jgi:hypothetical protein
VGTVVGDQVPPDFQARTGFVMADAAVVVASAVIS